MRFRFLIGILAIVPAIFPADIKLIHADRMKTNLSGDLTIIDLSGNIAIRHEGRVLNSDFARWRQQSGEVKFIGNVRLSDKGQIIETDTLYYRRDDKYARGLGNVRVSKLDSSLLVTGREGIYRGITEELTMLGEPHLTSIDTVDSSIIELDAKKLKYDIKIERGTATGDVKVAIKERDTTQSPVYIDADSIVFFPERDQVFAYGNVIINRLDMRATADSATYFRSAGKFELLGNPQLTQTNNRLTGHEMEVFFENGKIQKMWVYGKPEKRIKPVGFWHPPEDSLGKMPESRFTAQKMLFEFEDNQLDLATMIGEASNTYYPWTEDSLKLESNDISGDSICIWFDEGKLDSIEVHRGAIGKYISTEYSQENADIIDSQDTLNYQGDRMFLSNRNQTVAVQGSGKLRYGDISLDAGNVKYDIEKEILHAEPIEEGDSVVGYPVLSDRTQTMTGKKIIYNVKSERGRMLAVNTEFDMGYFKGNVVHKAEGDTLYISKSRFIPCECETSRTNFRSNKVKIIPNKQAVAKNIVLYISDLPVFAIPFFVFPIRKGRQSGLLTFDIGQFQEGERFIRNVGYYWAPSEYWDLKTSFDFDEGSGWNIKGKTQYAVRYKLKGNLSASYEIERIQEFRKTTGANRWALSGSHVQNLGPKSSLSGKVSYVSDKDYLSDVEYSPQERMERNLTSNLAYSRSFDWGSLSASVDRTENLETGRVTTYLPKLRISRYSGPLFEPDSELDRKFYHNLSLSISGNAVHYDERDTSSQEKHIGAQSDFSLSMPFSIGPFVSFNPSANGHLVAIDSDRDSTEWPARFTYGTSIGANTNLYGTFPFNGFIGIESLKHNITPNVSFAWTPEFEDASNFYSFGGISPGYSSERQFMNMSLAQDFFLTTEADTNQTGRKINLASLDMTSSYDFLAEERPLSDLSTSLRTSPFKWLSIVAGFTHSFYTETGDENKFWLRSQNLTTELSFRGTYSFGDTLNNISRNYRLGLSHYLSETRSEGSSSITHWIKADASTFITKNWKIDYSIYFDLDDMNKVSEEIRIWRDMNCWEAVFVWVPSGYREGWYFKINIKKLPDIKIEGTRGNVR